MRQRTIFSYLVVASVAALVGLGAGLGAGYWRWHKVSDPFEFRRWVTMNRVADAPVGGVLLFGDSIVERQYFPQMCGLPVFNVGLSSSRTRDHQPMLAELMMRTKPKWVVISSGANDLYKGTPISEWRPVVRDMLQTAGRRAIVFGVPPTLHPDAGPYNDVLRAEVQASGGKFIQPLPMKMTVDGLHPNVAGYREWKRLASAACATMKP